MSVTCHLERIQNSFFLGCNTPSVAALGFLGAFSSTFCLLDRLRKTARLDRKQSGAGVNRNSAGASALLRGGEKKNHFIFVYCCRRYLQHARCGAGRSVCTRGKVVCRIKGLKLQSGSLLLEKTISDSRKTPRGYRRSGATPRRAPGKGVLVAAGLRGLGKTRLVSKEDFQKRSCRDAKDRVSSSLARSLSGWPRGGGGGGGEGHFFGHPAPSLSCHAGNAFWGGEGNFHPVA